MRFYEYCDSGSWTQSTYDSNESDFQHILLKQKILVDMTNRSLATTLIGQDVKMPMALAPTGFCGMQHPNGEILAARAASEAGIPFTLSTMSKFRLTSKFQEPFTVVFFKVQEIH